MSEQIKMLLIHIIGVAVVALAVWVSTLIKGSDEAANGLRVMLIGGAAGLYGKLGFKPAGPVLDRIVEQMAHKEPARIARLTSNPPPPTVHEVSGVRLAVAHLRGGALPADEVQHVLDDWAVNWPAARALYDELERADAERSKEPKP